MSKRYRLGFSTESYGWVYFDAESDTHAENLQRQVEDGDLDFDELPNAYVKTNGGQSEVINDYEEAN